METIFNKNQNEMKIGILTQPLTNNYGGLLQAYALQTTLMRLGHNVVILNRPMPPVSYEWTDNIGENTVRFVKNCVKFFLRRPLTTVLHELLPEQRAVTNRYTDLFISKYLHKSPDFLNTEELAVFAKTDGIEAFVVGSDQCWRPQYSPCLPNYFLDFAEDWDVKRLSYAASFGVDTWEFSKKETRVCSPLVKKFNAVSVREESGITLCKEHLGVDAVHVLDPTMLLDEADYNSLLVDFNSAIFNITPEHCLPNILHVSGKKLFNYVLDLDAGKKQFIQNVANTKRLTPVFCMPKDFRAQEVFEKCPDDCTFPPVELWLQSFRDAEMVIADSFHGTVFSIIYNKPFWVLGNPDRGMARFQSLLKMFGLEERLVTTDKLASLDFDAPIDWNAVNARREELKQMSISFIKDNLK